MDVEGGQSEDRAGSAEPCQAVRLSPPVIKTRPLLLVVVGEAPRHYLCCTGPQLLRGIYLVLTLFYERIPSESIDHAVFLISSTLPRNVHPEGFFSLIKVLLLPRASRHGHFANKLPPRMVRDCIGGRNMRASGSPLLSARVIQPAILGPRRYFIPRGTT